MKIINYSNSYINMWVGENGLFTIKERHGIYTAFKGSSLNVCFLIGSGYSLENAVELATEKLNLK